MREQTGVVGYLEIRGLQSGDRTLGMGCQELLLIVIARTPNQNLTDRERLATHMTDDCLGSYPIGRLLVVSAARGMDVRIAGVPAPFRGVDPAFQLNLD